eukprot:SAG31_NODE_23634_length_500_cov_0.623441_2_plen_64_part_01
MRAICITVVKIGHTTDRQILRLHPLPTAVATTARGALPAAGVLAIWLRRPIARQLQQLWRQACA